MEYIQRVKLSLFCTYHIKCPIARAGVGNLADTNILLRLMLANILMELLYFFH